MEDSYSEGLMARPARRLPRPEAIKLIPEEIARRYSAIPLEVCDHTLRVAMLNPADIFALEALAAQSQLRIEPEAATALEIQEAIDFSYKSYDEIEKRASSMTVPGSRIARDIARDSVSEAPVAQVLTLIIDEAVKARASDIHLHPQEDKLRVRFRIDGALQDMLSLPRTTATPLITRIKVLASMNIADQHRPQDGQFSVNAKGRLIDIRVATIATVNGEIATLRLLDKSRATLSLAELGFLPGSLAVYQKMLDVPYGMLVVSGPTGAGKTTTLYASVNCLDRVGRNLVTIEDPVEYRFKDISQIQVNQRAGITFSSGLRSILRHDPDVILVGEIRDAETAAIAVQSALTGHLVLSSIHANDAVGVIFRLLDLGIEPFLVSSALIGVVAQRMVRRVCPDCARLVDAPLVERVAYAEETGEERDKFYYGTGCESCTQTGYRGRTGIFELLHMSDGLRAMLLKKDVTDAQLRKQAVQEDMVPLMKDGMLKVQENITTPCEVLRNAVSIDR